MKKTIYSLSVLLLAIALLQGCKKGDKQMVDLGAGEIVKYAKFSSGAYKDQELKSWGATLSKTEPVKLMEIINVQIKDAPVEIAKVKLSDNSILYVQAKNLADKPIVFIEDTKAYVRNNASSKIFAVIPKGSIGFITQEGGEWIQVYVGKIDGKWVTQHWVNSGYTAEDAKVQEGKLYEEAAAILADPSASVDQRKQAEENLKTLTSTTGIFAEMAQKLLNPEAGTGGTDSQENKGQPTEKTAPGAQG